MKTNLISLLSGLLLVVQYSHAQIDVPNGDFESWGLYNSWNYTPQDWNTGNFQLHEHVFIDSLAFEGEKAMKVYPYTFFEPYPGYASTYFELPNETPASLDFYYKSSIGTDVEVDSVYVSIQLFSDDILMLDHSWNTDETQLEWTEVHLELPTVITQPTHAQVTVQAGYAEAFLEGSYDTWISVDGIRINDFSSIDEVSNERFLLSRWGDFLEIKSDLNHLNYQIIDMQGKVIAADHNSRISIGSLSSGMYVLRVFDNEQFVGNTTFVK